MPLWLAQGKSNEEAAWILYVGIDTMKAHVKALYDRTGSEGSLDTAIFGFAASLEAQQSRLAS